MDEVQSVKKSTPKKILIFFIKMIVFSVMFVFFFFLSIFFENIKNFSILDATQDLLLFPIFRRRE